MTKTTPNNKIVLGFDFGTKYIGIAIGQTITNTARPLACLISKNNIDWQTIDQLIGCWNPKHLIVGVPLDIRSHQQQLIKKCLDFAKQLNKNYKIPVHQIDEVLSSWEAKRNLALLKKTSLSKEELLKINANAAAILVTQWLNETNLT